MKQLRDMSEEERLAWGLAESRLRKADLADVKSAEALKVAQANAKARRLQIGASRNAAADLVIAASRHLRQAGL